MTKKKIFVWACDYSDNTGEGKLARLFLNKMNEKDNFYFILNQKKKIKQKYLSTIFGIIYCWKKFLKNERVCYLNYLPLWNFLIFIFLPPKTILGPITGGANYSKSNLLSYFTRGIIFPIFYKISEYSLSLRKSKLVFSTDLLKKYLSKRTIKKSSFNFVVKNFLLTKKVRRRKKIDFLIYYRKHNNKISYFPYNLVKKLIRLKYKVHIVGDKLNFPNIKNYGFISSNNLSNLQSLAKYTIISHENPYSFFILECLSNDVKIIVKQDMKRKIILPKKNLIKLDYDSFNSIKKLRI